MNCISTLWSVVVQKLAGINTCTSVSEPVITIKNNILPLTYLTILGPYNHANITNLHTNKYNKNQINRPNALCQSEVIYCSTGKLAITMRLPRETNSERVSGSIINDYSWFSDKSWQWNHKWVMFICTSNIKYRNYTCSRQAGPYLNVVYTQQAIWRATESG